MYREKYENILKKVEEIKKIYKEEGDYKSLFSKLEELQKIVANGDSTFKILKKDSNDDRKDLLNSINKFAEKVYKNSEKYKNEIELNRGDIEEILSFGDFKEKSYKYCKYCNELLKKGDINELICEFTKTIECEGIKTELFVFVSKIERKLINWNKLEENNLQNKLSSLLKKIIRVIPKNNEKFKELAAYLEENLYTNDKTNCDKLYENFLLEYLRIIDKDGLRLKNDKEETELFKKIKASYDIAYCNRMGKSLIEQIYYEKIMKAKKEMDKTSSSVSSLKLDQNKDRSSSGVSSIETIECNNVSASNLDKLNHSESPLVLDEQNNNLFKSGNKHHHHHNHHNHHNHHDDHQITNDFQDPKLMGPTFPNITQQNNNIFKKEPEKKGAFVNFDSNPEFESEGCGKLYDAHKKQKTTFVQKVKNKLNKVFGRSR